MSGIAALWHLDGAPAAEADLQAMAARLTRRGPDGRGHWHRGPLGLVHTLLASLPEDSPGGQPLVDASSGCVICADVRLDNRDELLARLDPGGRLAGAPDAALITAAYLARERACLEHLEGDFAFVLWDPRRRHLFCGRDRFGLRPLYYHHHPGHLFACASTPEALLALAAVPGLLNEGRIADFLLPRLEGLDRSSSFFEEIHRLPAAHALRVEPNGVETRRWWRLEPGPELRLADDRAYEEAFREVFAESVRRRLRGRERVGATLSGGLDSGAVTAVARTLRAEASEPPLPTFSGTSPEPEGCVETRAILAAAGMGGLDPLLICHGRLDDYLPELEPLAFDPQEPFDYTMTLHLVLCLAARRRGLKVVLDGAGGDVVFSEGSHLARLLRAGRWPTARAEAVAQNRYWRGAYPPGLELLRNLRMAFTPEPMRRLRHGWHGLIRQVRARRAIHPTLIDPDFARRVRLADRLHAAEWYRSRGWYATLPLERAAALDHPWTQSGRERYERVASSAGIEAADPFLDSGVAAFGVSLPGEQKLKGGWPKAIVRRSLAGLLPDPVRWRPGKEHLGAAFTAELAALTRQRQRDELETARDRLAAWLKMPDLLEVMAAGFERRQPDALEKLVPIAHLAAWLNRRRTR